MRRVVAGKAPYASLKVLPLQNSEQCLQATSALGGSCKREEISLDCQGDEPEFETGCFRAQAEGSVGAPLGDSNRNGRPVADSRRGISDIVPMNKPHPGSRQVIHAFDPRAWPHDQALLPGNKPGQPMSARVEPFSQSGGGCCRPRKRIRDMKSRDVALAARKRRYGFIASSELQQQLECTAAAFGELRERQIVAAVKTKTRPFGRCGIGELEVELSCETSQGISERLLDSFLRSDQFLPKRA